ncbi:hypothetical protein, partial [Vibrio parahaemolyticus]|uniref:hypothetical protein n=1 Tax=Vibrio parahaemolyticus TaxID=670 RepID=UPI0019D6DEF3
SPRVGVFTCGQRYAGPDYVGSGSTAGTLSPLTCVVVAPSARVGMLSPAAFCLSALLGSHVAASTLGVDSGVLTPASMPRMALLPA